MDSADRDIFGSHEIAFECLADEERTANFAVAIAEVVKPGMSVVELGTGTGILSLLAARAGAARVQAFELSKPMAAMARRNVEANGLSDVIEIVVADVTELDPTDAVAPDVLIAEMISIGLIEEQLVPAFNRMLGVGLLRPGVRCIPSGQRTWLELGEWDLSFHAFEMPMIQIEQTWQRSRLVALVGEPVVVSEVDFEGAIARGEAVDEAVEAQVRVRVGDAGRVNAVRVGGESVLSPSVRSGWTQCMNSPAVVPVEPRDVAPGELLEAVVSYEMGGEFSTFRFDWK